MVATRRAKAVATARAFKALDVDMLSGIASFGGKRELWSLAVILPLRNRHSTGLELMPQDATFLASRDRVVLGKCVPRFRSQEQASRFFRYVAERGLPTALTLRGIGLTAVRFGRNLRRLETWALSLGPVRPTPFARLLTGRPDQVTRIMAMGQDGAFGRITYYTADGQECAARGRDNDPSERSDVLVNHLNFEPAPDLEEDEERGRAAALVRRLVAGVYHHGCADITCTDDTADAIEFVHIVSLRGAEARRVVFLVFAGSQNTCQKGCWCSGMMTVSVFFKVGAAAFERLATVSYAEPVNDFGGDSGDNRFFAAPAETCGRLATALGIDVGDVGFALRTVLLAADIQKRGLHTWMCLERLARRGDDQNFNSGIDNDVGAAAQEEQDLRCFGGAACRTFPFETQVGRPHFFDGSGEGGSRRPLLESPRKVLPDTQRLVERRLDSMAATSSICATVKALKYW